MAPVPERGPVTASACGPRSSAPWAAGWSSAAVHFSLFKGPGFSVDRRGHPRRSRHRHRAHRLCRIRKPGSRARPLVAARRPVRDRLHPAGRRQHQPHQIRAWPSGVGPLEFRLLRQSFGDEHRARPCTSATAASISNSATRKSVFYLTETDLDISPPGSRGSGWSVYCSAKPARTDRSAQGLGSFTLSGRWYVAPERVDLDLRARPHAAWAKSRR